MSKLTEQAIKASFLKLLNERPLTRITVKDITQDCGINRNSFYYHYHDIPALAEEIVLDRTNRLIEAYPDISTLEECVQAAFRFILENRRAVSHIYHSVNREVFEQYLMRICDHTIRTWFRSAFPDTSLGRNDQERLLKFVRCELFGACIDWMNQGMPEDVMEDIQESLALSLKLVPVLFPDITRKEPALS